MISALDPSNKANVFAALSLGTAAPAELITFRNFFAHRGRSTATKVADVARSHRLQPGLHPASLLAEYPPQSTEVLIVEYLTDLRLIIKAM